MNPCFSRWAIVPIMVLFLSLRGGVVPGRVLCGLGVVAFVMFTACMTLLTFRMAGKTTFVSDALKVWCNVGCVWLTTLITVSQAGATVVRAGLRGAVCG